MAFSAGVTFGPLVIRSHAVDGYLTTPVQFGSFSPVVGSPYFLGVVPVTVAAPPAKADKVKAAPKKASQVHFSMHTINTTTTPHRGQKSRGEVPRRWRPVSHTGKTTNWRFARLFRRQGSACAGNAAHPYYFNSQQVCRPGQTPQGEGRGRSSNNYQQDPNLNERGKEKIF